MSHFSSEKSKWFWWRVDILTKMTQSNLNDFHLCYAQKRTGGRKACLVHCTHFRSKRKNEMSHHFYLLCNESDCVQDFYIKTGCLKSIRDVVLVRRRNTEGKNAESKKYHMRYCWVHFTIQTFEVGLVCGEGLLQLFFIGYDSRNFSSLTVFWDCGTLGQKIGVKLSFTL